jgi:hypothetical protein
MPTTIDEIRAKMSAYDQQAMTLHEHDHPITFTPREMRIVLAAMERVTEESHMWAGLAADPTVDPASRRMANLLVTRFDDALRGNAAWRQRNAGVEST